MYKTIGSALSLALAPLALSSILAEPAAAAPLRKQAGPYELEVLIDGVPAQAYAQNGETFILGQRGARYTLRLQNRSDRRIEAVVSVDGRDVIDGRPADYHKRGYLVPAYGQVEIDGWRLSGSQAAAFRFSSVANSYAARTGSAREVGVIGVAIFPERHEPPYRVYVPTPRPRPYMRGRDDIYGYGDEAQAAPPAAKSAPAPSEDRASSAAPPPPAAYGEGGLAQSERKAMRGPSSRPGLGTGFGERVESPVEEVPFVRQSASQPSTLLGVRYNDRAGLLAMGIDVDGDGYYDGEVYRRRTAQPFPNNQNRYATPPPGWSGY
jgi:hypothetical protein